LKGLCKQLVSCLKIKIKKRGRTNCSLWIAVNCLNPNLYFVIFYQATLLILLICLITCGGIIWNITKTIIWRTKCYAKIVFKKLAMCNTYKSCRASEKRFWCCLVEYYMKIIILRRYKSWKVLCDWGYTDKNNGERDIKSVDGNKIWQLLKDTNLDLHAFRHLLLYKHQKLDE